MYVPYLVLYLYTVYSLLSITVDLQLCIVPGTGTVPVHCTVAVVFPFKFQPCMPLSAVSISYQKQFNDYENFYRCVLILIRGVSVY